jgi:predicted site-specific integrase-resolvase
LAETINQVRRGEIDPRISTAIGYLAAILLKAKQQDELDQRIKRLEAILDSQRTNCKTDVGSTFGSETFEFVNPTEVQA